MTRTIFAGAALLALLSRHILEVQGSLPVENRAIAGPRAIHRHYSAADQQLQRYAYVPFTVPAGATKIALSYQYDRANGANAVDLGLYEPGSLGAGSPALRGWSGGGRESVEIGLGSASPGYWPGPLPAGEWHVVLGLYRVAAGGVDVDLTIAISTGGRGATAPLRVQPPRVVKPGRAAWYAGVVHAHTVHSDGALTTRELIAKAAGEHLDFVAITDHNNTTHQLDEPGNGDVLVITGEEVTTPIGHFNVWGLAGPRADIDFRVGPQQPVDDLVDAAHRSGGLVSINHPTGTCLACTWTAAMPADLDAIEIANGAPDVRRQAIVLWDSLLRAGRRVTAVEGRDWHRGTERLGQPAVRVWSPELSTPAILEGIRAGRVIVLADARLPAPDVEVLAQGQAARIGDRLVIAAGTAITTNVRASRQAFGDSRIELLWNGEVVAGDRLSGGTFSAVRYPGSNGYLRVHIVSSSGALRAVTNPIYIVIG
jgi:hypothetical protein